MFPRLRASLALVLIALLPFHALLVTVITRLIAGPGHRPLVWLAVWKEAVLGVICLLALFELFRSIRRRGLSAIGNWQSAFDMLDSIILLSVAIGILVSILNSPAFAPAGASAGKQFSILNFSLGFKYNFLPLIAFLMLRRVKWSQRWRELAVKILVADGIILSAYGIATLFLPLGFFTALGYSDLHSLYLPDGPIAAFQQLGGSSVRRVQSAMSGPNQLGVWLLIPLGILLAEIRTKKVSSVWFLVSGFILLAGLVATFSRAAWVAAMTMALFAWFLESKPTFRLSGFLEGAGVVLLTIIAVALLIPSVFLRLQSTSDHLRRPVVAVQTMITHPFGLGLGSAGPASNRFSDTCVDLPAGSDISWAEDRQDLCVFVGRVKIQPLNRECNCPLLTENWYLQWGMEMGWVGLLLSLLLPLFVWRKFQVSGFKFQVGALATDDWPLAAFLAFLGVSIAGLFLHSFEDSAVAYSIWLSLASVLPVFEIPNASK